jgi:8-oxo-dGTP pyrophosphatase MutT (NUDIX family)
MNFAQKIYFNNKPLVLTTSTGAYIKENPIAEGYLSFTGAFPRNYRLAMDHLSKARSLGAIIEDISQRSLLDELHKIYEPIDAAGGIVTNEDGAVLMIYRRGKWDLPKGKCDDGEAIDECAVREVSEETGLQKLKLGDKICDTFHVYAQNGQSLLKRTAWYKMRGTTKEELVPQKEENILEARWVKQEDMGPIVYKSYEAVREVLLQSGLRW